MLNFFNTITPLSASLNKYLPGKLKSGEINKKESLITPGQKCDKMWYLESGAFVMYATDGRGGKFIIDVMIGPRLIWFPEYSFESCFSRHSIEAVSNCNLQWIHYGELWNELLEFREFSVIERVLCRIRCIADENKLTMMRERAVPERYHRCCTLYPGIEDLLSNQMIALFLNTSPETICRIRSGIQQLRNTDQN